MGRQVLLRLLFLCFNAFCAAAYGQMTVSWDSVYSPDPVHVCGPPETLVIKLTVNASAAVYGPYISIRFPPGITYTGDYSVLRSSGGAISYDTNSAAGRPVFIMDSLNGPDVITLRIGKRATCGSIGLGPYADTVTLDDSSSTYQSTSTPYNTVSASLSLTGISNSPATVPVGSLFTRSFNINNGGFGLLQHFYVTDKFPPGLLEPDSTLVIADPSGANYPVPPSRVKVSSDSVLFDIDTAILNHIGNRNGRLDYNETFVLSYKLRVPRCGNTAHTPSVLSTLWGCDSSYCQRSSASASISITASGTPGIQQLSREDTRPYCAGDARVDTLLIINNGSGTASGVTVSVWSNNGYTRGFDTTALLMAYNSDSFVKPTHLILSDTLPVTGSSCSGAVIRSISFSIDSIGANDTITLLLQNTICKVSNCNVGSVTSANIRTRVTYTGNCSGPVFASDHSFGTVYAMSFGDITFAPSGIVTGDTAIAEIQFTRFLFSPSSPNHIYEVDIDLPPGINMHGGSGNDMYGINRGNNTRDTPIYADPANGIYRYSGNQLYNLPSLYFNLAGDCGGGLNSGLRHINITLRTYEDTAHCPPTTLRCLSIPMYLYCLEPCDSSGLNFHTFTSTRKNIGTRDDNDDGLEDTTLAADRALIRTHSLTTGDTLSLYFAGVIDTSSADTSFSYLYAFFNDSSFSDHFSHIETRVHINRNNGTDTSFTYIPLHSNDSFLYDLSMAGPLFFNDSISIESEFVNALPTGNRAFTDIMLMPSFYVSRNPDPTGLARMQCGGHIESIRVYSALSTLFNASTSTFAGCSGGTALIGLYGTTDASYTVTANAFKNEYRVVSYPELLVWQVPPGYLFDSIMVSYTRRFGLGDSTQTAYSYNVPYSRINDSILLNTKNLLADYGGSFITSDEGYSMNVYYYLRPTCGVIGNTVGSPYTKAVFKGISSQMLDTVMIQTNSGPGLINNRPMLDVSSTQFITNAYNRNISWDVILANTTASATLSPNTWIYLSNSSGRIVTDSVSLGGQLILPDSAGLYRLGDLVPGDTAALKVYATHSSCTTDSIRVQYGYGCDAYPVSPNTGGNCAYGSFNLLMLPQLAEIQSIIRPLAGTQSSPADSSSGVFGSATIDMCTPFPVEIVISSAQLASIHNTRELIYLPLGNGQAGLDYIPDSGYIEYPEGTVPRPFSASANSSLSVSGSPTLTLDLAQIDPANFGSGQGLPGASDLTRNKVILRFKLKTNCNFISGSSFDMMQSANSYCYTSVTGSGQLIRSNDYNITGVVAPYNMLVSVQTENVEGCGNAGLARIRLQKIGGAAVGNTDSIFITIPAAATAGVISCSGSLCPSPTPAYTSITNGNYTVLGLPVPAGMSSLDTLNLVLPLSASGNYGCSYNESFNCQVTKKTSIYCPASGDTCFNSSVLIGSGNTYFNIRKADLRVLGLSAYVSSYLAPYKYQYWGYIYNFSGVPVPAGDTTRMKVYLDVNGNNIFDPATDSLMAVKDFDAGISAGFPQYFYDSFSTVNLKPDSTKGLFAVLSISSHHDHCFCDSLQLSNLVTGLPVYLSPVSVSSSGCSNTLRWTTYSELHNKGFDVERSSDGENFVQIGTLEGHGNSQVQHDYEFTDSHPLGNNIYRLKQTDLNNSYTYSEWLYAANPCGKDPAFRVYPNPNETGNWQATIYWSGAAAEAKITVLNSLSQPVCSHTYTLRHGLNTLHIPCTALATGIYTLRAEAGTAVFYSRVIRN